MSTEKTASKTVAKKRTNVKTEVREDVDLNPANMDMKPSIEVIAVVGTGKVPASEIGAYNIDEATAVNPQVNTTPYYQANNRNNTRIRYDYETGYVLLRVSNHTIPNKLAGAITKHFKDGARALVVSFIGLDAMSISLKGVGVAQIYIAKETVDRMVGKKLAIVPEFHEFKNENGNVDTMKFTLYLVDELK